jgi:hypothetical protein
MPEPIEPQAHPAAVLADVLAGQAAALHKQLENSLSPRIAHARPHTGSNNVDDHS